MRYLLFKFTPLFLLVVIMSGLLIWMTKSNDKPSELTASFVISVSSLAILIAYYSINIFTFLYMIKKQEKNYKIKFDDKNAVILEKHSSWIVCSDNWLFSPGRFAIYRKEIKSASVGEAYHANKTGVIYPIKIKTLSGKVLNLKFKNEKEMKAVRKWARR